MSDKSQQWEAERRASVAEQRSNGGFGRLITLPTELLTKQTEANGRWREILVHVDWPELQLSEQQILENMLADLAGKPEPHPDRSFFSVLVPVEALAVTWKDYKG